MNEIVPQSLILKFMYNKHIVTLKYVEICLLRDNISLLQNNITEEQIKKYDQDHFNGFKSTDKCINKLRFSKEDYVLDIGSGLGGPARYISFKTKCKVLGIEIQQERFRSM